MLNTNSITGIPFKKISDITSMYIGKNNSLGKLFICAVSLIIIASCNICNSDNAVINFEYDLSQSDHNWEAFFTNYYVGREEKMNLTSDYKKCLKH